MYCIIRSTLTMCFSLLSVVCAVWYLVSVCQVRSGVCCLVYDVLYVWSLRVVCFVVVLIV